MNFLFQYIDASTYHVLETSGVAFILYIENTESDGGGEFELVSVNDKGVTVYHTPTVNQYKDKKLFELFPILDTICNATEIKKDDTEWKYCDLKEGDHLFVRREYRNVFLDEVVGRAYHINRAKLRDKWKDAAVAVLYKKFVTFGYEMKDGWGRIIRGLYVFDQEENNVVCTFPCHSRFCKDMNPLIQILTIKEHELLKIKRIIRNRSEVFDIVNIEFPAILDGVENWFRFSVDGEAVDLSASNIYAYREYKSVNAKKVIALFDEIADVLMTAGVDEKYLHLFPEELR